MKYLLALLLTFTLMTGISQIVNIPDPGFKAALINQVPGLDANGDGEVQVSEAQAVTKIWRVIFGGTNITGIKSFSNLDSLYLVSTINATGMINPDLSGMTNISVVYLANCAGNINISGCTNLKKLTFDNSTQTNLIVTGLNLTGAYNLRDLTSFCSFTTPELDLRSCDSLTSLELGYLCNIQTLNTSGLTKLRRIKLQGENFGSIIARNCTALTSITAYIINDLLDLSGSNILDTLSVNNYKPTILDLSTCIKLRRMELTAPNLRYLNLKNGSLLQYMSLLLNQTNPFPINICTDDFETATIISYMALYASVNDSITINSFCTGFPGGNYNNITGKIRRDANGTGCDNGDPLIPNVPVKVTDGAGNSITRFSNATGDYNHYVLTGNFTQAPYFPYPYYSINPVSSVTVFDTANSIIDTVDFCITSNGIHNQLDITFLPIGNARPGFPSRYQVTYRNRGTTTLSGNFFVNYDNGKLAFNSASDVPASQLAGQLSWNYTNLNPFETRNVDVYFTLLPPPVNNFGDTLLFMAVINPVAGDAIPSDNSFILPQGIRGSFDPNDKQCLEGEKVSLTELEGYLNYLIRFQNMGNDTAFNIVVTDTLSGNFDWESFDFISGSHACNVICVNNRLQFFFENIQLPYQSINDAGSNGFIAYRIKPKNTLVVGDSLNNTASIYFDFNPPVVTNKTTMIVSLQAPVPVKLEYFSLARKGNSNQLCWKVCTTDYTTRFYIERSSDAVHFKTIGNITANAQRCLLPFYFTDDKPLPAKNYYRIRIVEENGFTFYSKILYAENGKQELELTAIVSELDQIDLYLNSPDEQNVQIKLIHADGRTISSQRNSLVTGPNRVKLNLKNLAKGIYAVVVYTSERSLVSKMFVQ
jgi:uncharacterized repeat protein (TIGR01451 family)